MNAPPLEMHNISKTFPGVRALQNAQFDLRQNEIHALVGENGAGKSTLIKILSGVYSLDEGEILLDGQSIQPRNPTHAQALGISPVHQELNLEPYLTVAENIFLGRQPLGRLGLIDYARMHSEAAALLAQLGMTADTNATVGSLSVAERQMIAIARAVSIDSRIVILDEPTSPLTERETEMLFTIVRRLKRAAGWASSTSRTAWKKSSACATGSPCSATAQYIAHTAGCGDQYRRPDRA